MGDSSIQEFQLVKSKSKRERYSGLYNFLSNNKDWIKSLNLAPNAVIIKPDYIILAIDINNFSNQKKLTVIEWHLRIDRNHNECKKFLSQWHHTLTYLQAEQGQESQPQILRTYYNNGIFLDMTLNSENIIDTKIIQEFNNYTMFAKHVALELISMWQHEQQKLHNEFDILATKIYDSINNNSNISVNGINGILVACGEINQQLTNIDEYTTNEPIRHLKEHIEFIIKKQNILASKKQTPIQALEDKHIKTKPHKKQHKNKTAPKKINAFKLEEIKEKLKPLLKNSNNPDLSLIISAFNQIESIKLQTLELYNTCPEITEEIDTLYLDIINIKDLTTIYKNLIYSGNFDEAINLFDHININSEYEKPKDQTIFFYGELLVKCLNIEATPDTEQKYADFFNKIYNRSEHYRSALSILFLTTMFDFSFKNTVYSNSALIELAKRNKDILFKTFYMQLESTTLVGFRCNNRSNDILSSLITLKSDSPLIEFLIQQGFPSEHSSTELLNIEAKNNSKKNERIFKVLGAINYSSYNNNIHNFQLLTARDAVSVPSAFYHACLQFLQEPNENRKYQINNICLLAKQASSLNLILGICVLICAASRITNVPCAFKGKLSFTFNDETRVILVEQVVNDFEKFGAKSICTIVQTCHKDLYELYSTVVKIYEYKLNLMTDRDKFTVYYNLQNMIKSETNIQNSIPEAASYNTLLALHLAAITSTIILPQTHKTYNLITNSVKELVKYLKNFKLQQIQSNIKKTILFQTMIRDSSLIDDWVIGYSEILSFLESFSYWDIIKQEPISNNMTPMYDQTVNSAATISDNNSKSKPKNSYSDI